MSYHNHSSTGIKSIGFRLFAARIPQVPTTIKNSRLTSTSSATHHFVSDGILQPFDWCPKDLQIEHIGCFRGPFFCRCQHLIWQIL